MEDLVQRLNVVPDLAPAMTRLERHAELIGMTIQMWVLTWVTYESRCHPWRMRKLLLLLALLPAMPVKAEAPEIQCPGQNKNIIEMRWCASQLLEESDQALQEQLSTETLEKWKAVTQEFCAAAKDLYREGTITPRWSLAATTDSTESYWMNSRVWADESFAQPLQELNADHVGLSTDLKRRSSLGLGTRWSLD